MTTNTKDLETQVAWAIAANITAGIYRPSELEQLTSDRGMVVWSDLLGHDVAVWDDPEQTLGGIVVYWHDAGLDADVCDFSVGDHWAAAPVRR